MNSFIISWALASCSMLAFDLAWLSLMAKSFYKPHIGHLMASSYSAFPAILFYIIYTFSLTYLVIIPALQGHTALWKLFFTGALFGLATYATYDLTNQATLKDWSLLVTAVDLTWGSLLAGTVAVISVVLTNYFA